MTFTLTDATSTAVQTVLTISITTPLTVVTNALPNSVVAIPYGANVLCDDGHIISAGDRMAEWDPFTMPVITENPGVVKYQDLVEGQTLAEQTDEATGISQKVVTEFRPGR